MSNSKVCLKCNAKNNPVFSECWKCKEKFEAGTIKMAAITETVHSDVRKCFHCRMEIPQGGTVCPYCRKDPGFGMALASSAQSLFGNLIVLSLIVLSFFIFPWFWAGLFSMLFMGGHK